MIKKTDYKQAPAMELTTDSVRLVAPLSFGPRILHFGAIDGPNLLLEFENETGAGPDGNFYFRGGHRLWHAPEHTERTYQPDNDAPAVEPLAGGRGFSLRQKTEAATGIRKMVQVETIDRGAVAIDHELSNEGLWPVTCAPWALTMFRPGGRGIIPLPPKGEHPRDLLPEYALVPWSYTDFSSGGWSFAPSYIGLNTAEVKSPQKLGITGYPGWMAYWLDGVTFIKAASFNPADMYPDNGCKAEVFSNGEMIELETLGALVSLQPGASARHREYWGILPGLPEPVDERAIREGWLPRVERWLSDLPAGAGAIE